MEATPDVNILPADLLIFDSYFWYVVLYSILDISEKINLLRIYFLMILNQKVGIKDR